MKDMVEKCPLCETETTTPDEPFCPNCGFYMVAPVLPSVDLSPTRIAPEHDEKQVLIRTKPDTQEKKEKAVESTDSPPIQTIHCPNCGQKNFPDARFCNHCGYLLNQFTPSRDIKKIVAMIGITLLLLPGVSWLLATQVIPMAIALSNVANASETNTTSLPTSSIQQTEAISMIEQADVTESPSVSPTTTASPTLSPTITHTFTPSATPTPTNTFTPTPTLGPVYIWQTKVIESARSVGAFSSLEIDTQGNFHVAYFEDSRDNVGYSRGNWITWHSEIVDSGTEVGFHVSLALDSNSFPHIAHHYLGKQKGIQPYLKYVQWTGSQWNSIYRPDTNVANTDVSLSLDAQDRPHFVYQDGRTLEVIYLHDTGSRWVSQPVDDASSENKSLPIVIDDTGKPHLTYFGNNGGLKYAYLSGIQWVIETVDADPGAGQFSDLVLDTAGNPHIAYYNRNTLSLYYARRGIGNWSITLIDNQGNVGQYPSIEVSKTGEIHISYYDLTNTALKYAHGRGSHWDIYQVDDDGNVGLYTSLALDKEGNPYISYYDESNEDLKYTATVPTTP